MSNDLSPSQDEPGQRAGQGTQSILMHLARDTQAKTHDETPHPEVFAAHVRWEAIHTTLRALEVELSDAVARYAQGQGPLPMGLVKEVSELRARCAVHFNALVATVAAQAHADDGGTGADSGQAA